VVHNTLVAGRWSGAGLHHTILFDEADVTRYLSVGGVGSCFCLRQYDVVFK
jgi:hypothetical protein